MKRIRDLVDTFLIRTGMHHRAVDMGKYCTIFLEEMRRGLDGEPSSLEMIPTYIDTSRELPRGEKVIAMDAGGTNLRVALVSFDAGGKQVIEDLARHRMPGSDGEVGKEEFFRALAGFVAPFAGRADRIGFCFSYPAEITPEKDGRLIYFSKEIRARGVEGQMIGGNLLEAMKSRGVRQPSRVVLLNDTVATLLAGRNSMPGRRFDDYIGFVCGTGLNTAYVDANTEIKKKPELDPAGSQIINTESGSFQRGPSGAIDEEFNDTTAHPGKYRNEKMISGAYIGGLCLATFRRAVRDGVVSAAAGGRLASTTSLSTREVNDFLISPTGNDNPLARLCAEVPPADAQALYLLADAIVERAAVLVAVNLCAVLLKTGKGLDPRFPVCVTVDGTTFWQMRGFRTRVECAMKSFLTGEREREFEITRADDAPLIGAAIAALTN
jgi:hexokinase